MQERKRKLRDGIEVRLWDAGQGPALLMLHGAGASGNSFLFNLPALSQHYRCVAPDLPGYGGSSLPAQPLSVAEQAGLMFELLDGLGIEQCCVFGHSMGCIIAIEMALQGGERVPRLMLEDPPGARADSMERAGRTLLSWVREDGMPRILTLEEARCIAENVDESFIELANMDFERARGFRQSLVALAAYGGFARAAGVKCPTLVLWGERDRIMPSAEATDWQSAIAGSTVHVFEGVGHCPHFETTQQFHDVMLRFLA